MPPSTREAQSSAFSGADAGTARAERGPVHGTSSLAWEARLRRAEQGMDEGGCNPVQEAWRDIERSFADDPDVELTVLMPCLNEAETLAACIEKAQAFIARA